MAGCNVYASVLRPEIVDQPKKFVEYVINVRTTIPSSAYDLEDDVPAEVKAARAEEIMAIQQEVSMRLNGEKVGKEFKVLIDRKEGNFFIGRTEFDSPDVDNEVLIDASKYFVRQGDFVQVKVYEASDYDLFAEPVK